MLLRQKFEDIRSQCVDGCLSLVGRCVVPIGCYLPGVTQSTRTPIKCGSVMWLLAEAKHLARIWLLKSSIMPAAMKMKELENDIHGEVNSNHRGSRNATHKTPSKDC
ncbi:hypothetical protein EYF80_051209 [Liparis tanakae]|uniref:Uncharacterized protein n=1 Tax=Liparis tanakae TaxID=230148 RepID=A0A4Z2FCK8_9TELE|nr:hypothetical protein EYF80_051209 [Liparis tanakae]